ncbi:Trihelix transcription factor [Melia azedarach]|uniref:Trihelix transcription factor n=1 Tax=Melia azedarach TaxID=155640 RepID=A0ACC1XNZ2_MELAZ|nr:Trihelix transcription factor [Melia azedarach]
MKEGRKEGRKGGSGVGSASVDIVKWLATIVAEWLLTCLSLSVCECARHSPPAHSSIFPSPTQFGCACAPTLTLPSLNFPTIDNDNNHQHHLFLLLFFYLFLFFSANLRLSIPYFAHSSAVTSIMSTPTTTTTKRVPPPCWTHDETLALINAYGARWLSLNRGNLRTSDWDAVSSAVLDSSPGASKSSIQCRHKIEKLRKRYRAEKQRSLSLPGRFISSWDLFPLLDSMNFGSSSAAGLSNQSRDFSDQKIMDVTEFRLNKNLMTGYDNKIDGDFNQDFGLNRDLRSDFLRNYGNIDFDDDFGCLASRAKDYVKIGGDLKSTIGSDRDFRVGYGVKVEDGRNFVSPQGFRLKSYRKTDDDNSSPNLDVNGFPVRTFGDRILVTPPGFKPRNYGKINENFNPDAYYDPNADYEVPSGSGSEFYAKTFGDGDFVPLGTRSKYYGRVDVNLNGSVDCPVMNESGSASRLRFGKRNGDGGIKRVLDPFEELASSMTLLTERFAKMEKMKMEMARETQKMRMEMEMKHNQMILESQKHLLDIFVSGFVEKKGKKKVKVELLMSPNMSGKRDEAQ